MNTMETIFSRKSIREYIGTPISETQMQTILKAANAAPVGMGQYENVHLTVITDPDLLAKIDSAGAALMQRPDIHPLYGAPCFILVSAKITPGMENVSYSNAAMIIHNMALAATNLGVGSCYIWGAIAAINAQPELVQALNLPEGFTPCSGLIVGETDETYEEREIPSDRIACNTI